MWSFPLLEQSAIFLVEARVPSFGGVVKGMLKGKPRPFGSLVPRVQPELVPHRDQVTCRIDDLGQQPCVGIESLKWQAQGG